MRRLGFLEVLVCDCVESGEPVDAQLLGEKLWQKVEDRQTIWLQDLATRRGLNNEVGRITSRIASRYVKLATEIGLLTRGDNKTLTDLGRTFKSFRREEFFLDNNPGQRLLYVRELFLRRDNLVVSSLCSFVFREQPVRKDQVYDWFVREFVPQVMESKSLDEGLAIRLRTSAESYTNPETRRLGVDRIKHMVDTRLEHLVDLEVLGKTKGPKYFAKPLGSRLSRSPQNEEVFYNSVAAEFGGTTTASDEDVALDVVLTFEKLRQPPLNLVPLSSLHDSVIIGGIVGNHVKILPTQIERVEEWLAKQYYGKVIFFEGKEGRATNLTISEPDQLVNDLRTLVKEGSRRASSGEE